MSREFPADAIANRLREVPDDVVCRFMSAHGQPSDGSKQEREERLLALYQHCYASADDQYRAAVLATVVPETPTAFHIDDCSEDDLTEPQQVTRQQLREMNTACDRRTETQSRLRYFVFTPDKDDEVPVIDLDGRRDWRHEMWKDKVVALLDTNRGVAYNQHRLGQEVRVKGCTEYRVQQLMLQDCMQSFFLCPL